MIFILLLILYYIIINRNCYVIICDTLNFKKKLKKINDQ